MSFADNQKKLVASRPEIPAKQSKGFEWDE